MRRAKSLTLGQFTPVFPLIFNKNSIGSPLKESTFSERNFQVGGVFRGCYGSTGSTAAYGELNRFVRHQSLKFLDDLAIPDYPLTYPAK